MTIPQSAIDAVAEAIFDAAPQLEQEDALDDPTPEKWRKEWRDYIGTVAIEAAIPHIREQIAQEIDAMLTGEEDLYGVDLETLRTVKATKTRATRIARGKDTQ